RTMGRCRIAAMQRAWTSRLGWIAVLVNNPGTRGFTERRAKPCEWRARPAMSTVQARLIEPQRPPGNRFMNTPVRSTLALALLAPERAGTGEGGAAMRRRALLWLALGAALTGAAQAQAQTAPSPAETAAYQGLHAAAQRGDVAAIAR